MISHTRHLAGNSLDIENENEWKIALKMHGFKNKKESDHEFFAVNSKNEIVGHVIKNKTRLIGFVSKDHESFEIDRIDIMVRRKEELVAVLEAAEKKMKEPGVDQNEVRKILDLTISVPAEIQIINSILERLKNAR